MIVQAKKEMRREMAARRRDLDHAALSAQANARLIACLTQHFETLSSVVLSGYMALPGESDPRACMTAHPGAVCVPVVRAAGQPLVFHRWTPEMPMVTGAFKALVPATAEPLIPAVVIVPLLAFDRRGMRLGYGGGFYDRTLAELRTCGRCTAIGFAFAQQEVDEVPTEATDQPLDMIVTSDEVMLPARM